MFALLSNTWALLFGMLLLMLGNGMQASLLGIRGALEGFTATEMSVVMSGYFLGFLVSSRAAPEMIRRVGHVRVFAAMASVISAVFILYAALPNVWAWGLMRIAVGACFAAVYVVAESWLNDSATNETRGKALSLYMIVQMLGVVAAQALLNVADPGGYELFVLISVAVSLSFAPILLSVSPAPVHQTAKLMSLGALFRASPLGFVGTVFLGAVFSAVFGMASVYGTERGFKNVSDSMQVCGGMGYTVDGEIEQYLRDVRIAMIYEGTNHIQALDLVVRKLRGRQGQDLADYSGDLTKFVEDNEHDPAVGAEVKVLRRASEALQATGTAIVEYMMAGKLDQFTLCASPFLTAMAHVTIAHLLLEGALIAEEARTQDDDQSQEEFDFYAGKVMSAKFFCNFILPEVFALCETISSGDRSALDVPDHGFSTAW